MTRVLFVCIGNSCRSQMAEASPEHMARASWKLRAPPDAAVMSRH